MSTHKPSPARTGIEERTDQKGVRRFRGTVYDKASGRRLRGRWTANLAEARSWQVDAKRGLRDGTLRAPTAFASRRGVRVAWGRPAR